MAKTQKTADDLYFASPAPGAILPKRSHQPELEARETRQCIFTRTGIRHGHRGRNHTSDLALAAAAARCAAGLRPQTSSFIVATTTAV